MRTSYIASPRQASTPHRYYTRNNTNPISPTPPQRSERENTPPTFLERRRNLLNQDTQESSDEEEDIPNTTVRRPAQKSLPKLLLNILSWIGLSFLAINVYILSLFKKVWVWRHPFQSTGYNTDNNYVNYYHRPPQETSDSQPAVASRLRTFISDSLPSTSPSSTSEVGWLGFISSLLFLSLLLYLFGVLLVPTPTLNEGVVSGEVFSYVEEMKSVTVKMLNLETSLGKLDEKTQQSYNELKSTISELEREREQLKSELVAIATLDRQQSLNIEELKKQTLIHTTQLTDIGAELGTLHLTQTSLRDELETLRQSITTVSLLQDQLSRDTETLAVSHRDTLSSLTETTALSMSEMRAELEKRQGELGEELRMLLDRQDSLQRSQDEMTDRITEKQLSGSEVDKSDVVTLADVQRIRQELTSLITSSSGETRSVLEEKEDLLAEYQERLIEVERVMSHLPNKEVVSDLLTRVDAVSRDLSEMTRTNEETVLGDIQRIRDQLDAHVSKSEQRIQDVYQAMKLAQDKAREESGVSEVRLQSIESKLAVLSALQTRLSEIEGEQTSAQSERKLESELVKLLSELRDLDKRHQEVAAELRAAISSINSDKTLTSEQVTADIKQQSVNIQLIKTSMEEKLAALQDKLVSFESNSDIKIRRVVLDVLASATRDSPETAFFSDWISDKFLSRDETVTRHNILERKEVVNETVTLPAQDKMISLIINELQTKHSINLSPASGITLADIRFIVSEALQTFDEDKTGQADFALEALGGSVITVGCTETYYEGAPYASFMSVPLFRIPNPPNVALQSDITPGKCWAFKGSRGYMMIKLARAVQVEGFSMEHLPRKLSLSNDISSAPQNFLVRGLSHPNDKSSHHFGDYSYSDTGPALQHFAVQHASGVAFEIVELEIESNHGNAEYTCLYRIRVHGTVPKLV